MSIGGTDWWYCDSDDISWASSAAREFFLDCFVLMTWHPRPFAMELQETLLAAVPDLLAVWVERTDCAVVGVWTPRPPALLPLRLLLQQPLQQQLRRPLQQPKQAASSCPKTRPGVQQIAKVVTWHSNEEAPTLEIAPS